MLRSGPANDMANPATEQATATPITAVKPRSGCCNSQPTIAGHADRGFKYGRSPTLNIVGRLAVEKAEQTGVQRGERQAGQNLADQNGRVAVQE